MPGTDRGYAIGGLRSVRAASAVVVALFVAGCHMAPDPVEIAPVSRLPQDFTGTSEAGTTEAVSWWGVFRDPVLTALVDTVLAANFDVREAVARVDEVRAQYRIARSALFPTIQASGDFSRFDQPANTGQFGAIFGGDDEGDDETPSGPTRPDRFSFETFGASVGFAYELDVWGRVRAGRGAAMADLMASAADARAVRVGVVSETIATYFEILELERRVRILGEQISLLGERLELTEDRYGRGVVTSQELYQIQQEYNGARAQRPIVESQVVDARGRLGILVGRFPGEVERLLDADVLPSVTVDAIPAGLPSSLLVSRPDVVAAAARLESARLRVGERRAARFPTLSLTGSAGQQSSELADLVRADQWFTNFVTSLTAPLFAGGRLAADEAAARARYEQEAARYARTVLTAFKDVEAALAAFAAQRERHALLQEQADAARASADGQRRRLELGIGDYVGYLDALRLALNVEITRATAERELAVARLNVHRALGGSWIESEEGP